MAAITIQGVNYKAVTPLAAQTYNVIPFDFGGKALIEMTIVADSTAGQIDINLPEIISSATPPAYSFGGVYGLTLTIIGLTAGTNDVVINTSGSDTIGSATDVTLVTDGASAVFTIVSDTNWSVIYTS